MTVNWKPIHARYAAASPLNKEKRTLQSLTDVSAADWLRLAEKYLDAGERGNYALCIYEAGKLESHADPDDVVVPAPDPDDVAADIPEPDAPDDFDWQERVDLA